MFLIATIAITEFFTAYRYIDAGETIRAITVISISLIAFVVSMTYLAYRMYADEKSSSNLRPESSFYFFDWLYSVEERFKNKKGLNHG